MTDTHANIPHALRPLARTSIRRAAICTALLWAGLTAPVDAAAQDAPQQTAISTPAKTAPAGWFDPVTASRSIYLVLEQSGDQTHSVATAFSIGNGMVATNAHVVEDGGQFLLRQAGTGTELRVASYTAHPGYSSFAKLTQEYPLYDAVTAQDVALVHAGDVAVMRVHREDRDKLAPALEIAPPRGLLGLNLGQDVAMLGFPQRHVHYNGYASVRPAPKYVRGWIMAVTDPWKGHSLGPEGLLVMHNLPSMPGSSGSPLLDRQGRVVAIHCAISADDGQPLPEFGYAQRADFLRELAEDRHLAAQQQRDQRWVAMAERATKLGQVGPGQRAARILAMHIDHLMEDRDLQERHAEAIRFQADDPIAHEISVVARGSGLIAAAAVAAVDHDIDMTLLIDGEVVAEDEKLDHFPIAVASVRAGQQVTVRVYGPAALMGSAFDLFIGELPEE